MRTSTALLITCFIVGGFHLPSAGALKKVEVYENASGKQAISPDFKTWSLFLICNRWKTSGRARFLYQSFQHFGDAIGDDNLAIWFWKKSMPISSPTLDDNVDVTRARRYCRAFHLDLNSGPYVVVTSTYPDKSQPTQGIAVFTLGSDPHSIEDLLDGLAGQIRRGGFTKASAQINSQASTAWWEPLLEGVRQCLGRFGCAWSFKLSAGPASADLKPCKS